MIHESGDYWQKVETMGESVIVRTGIGNVERMAVELSPDGARLHAEKLVEAADEAEESRG